ncbi:MAG TPA: class I SAM-dependent methyltransferase [Chthoniobacterales bacterium]|nr:class I SAM-dependent methyltransferase [Chthoniobacterales bacterium]
MAFKDHFSRQATDYAKFRPQYPRALFQFIAALAPNDRVALDGATGNGQAAVALAEFFQKVIALDASPDQIARAQPNERVEYRVAAAESTGLAAHSCAALTVAQALHWFERDAFYAEARRILLPGGVLAVWAYNELRITPGVDALVRRFHDDIVGPYWPVERKIVGRGYRNLPFPFAEIEPPELEIEVRWSLRHLLGYLRTWSATQRFLAAEGRDPVDEVARDLEAAWGDAATERPAIWPLTIRIGRA